MGQPGYFSCGGCGWMFKESDQAEVRMFQEHDCEHTTEDDYCDLLAKVTLDMKKEMGNNGL